MKTLLFGYGNPDRQDDGIAWHILRKLMQQFDLPLTEDLDINYHDESRNIDFLFQLQLMPEFASEIAEYDRVCFIDAHTGAVPEDVHIELIQPTFQNSPFTHHLTAASLLSITEMLHKKSPQAMLISVRGYEFEFTQSLSDPTQALIGKAVDTIIEWMK